MEQRNRLAQASSAYLRSAQHQPVAWHEWGDDAFAEAQRDDKPVLLDIGAVWCHWCHVMDRESYEDAGTAALINELFVAVKVDRDERPEVDIRYQAAVAAISGQGGWPLTAFLTPAGQPFFGGTYFPPEERYGRPSFARVLRSMAQAYRLQRGEVEETAASVVVAIEQNETFSGRGGALGMPLLDKIVQAILQQFDPRHGGFGSEPKFSHPAALDLLVDAAWRPGPLAGRAREVVALTLRKMANGGIHDQLAGGFHRYSVDQRWVVPHFEKLAYDNSELLRTYAHAFQSFREPHIAEVAASTLRWMNEWLTDQNKGGFYASQDADASLDDDGNYFTWTRAEAEAALTREEFEVAAPFYNLRAIGDMQHDPARNVLHVVTDVPSVAASLGQSEQQTRAVLSAARAKLYAARLQRSAPYVDKTIYTGWNGLCISAYLAAGRALGRPEATRFALQSLDRVLAAVWQPGVGLFRVVAYGEPGGSPQPVPGVLEDHVYLGMAALDAWEGSGELRYFTTAQQLGDRLLAHFYDEEGEGGFVDMDRMEQRRPRGYIGALVAKRKPLQDAPTPAGNPVAASLLLRLHALTGKELYRERALATLEAFAGVVEHFGLYAASYGQALRRSVSAPVQVCVVGDDAAAGALAAAAAAPFLLNKSVVRLRGDQMDSLPPALAATLPHVPGVRDRSVAVVCREFACLPPTADPDELRGLLHSEI